MAWIGKLLLLLWKSMALIIRLDPEGPEQIAALPLGGENYPLGLL
jgi:hypothetical protein